MKDLDLDDLLALLSQECVAAGSAAAWARLHGLSGSYVRDVLNEERRPGPGVLAALGVEKLTAYRRGKAN